MKRKKFAMGGPTDYASSGSAGGTKDMSFGEAFKAARAVAKREGRDPDEEIFTWKGKKYTAERADSKKAEAEETGTRGGPSTRGGPRTPTINVTAKRDRLKLPSDRATGYRSQVEETGMSPEERMNAVRDLAIGTAATVLPAARVARGAAAAMKAKDAASNMAGRVLARKGIPSYSERYAAGERAAARRATARAERKLDEKLASDMEGGFKRGGSVKRYASGGSVSSASKRADGIAKKGKTRGKYV
jgi:hypothetical protein